VLCRQLLGGKTGPILLMGLFSFLDARKSAILTKTAQAIVLAAILSQITTMNAGVVV